jgi:hypothetical protein
MLAANFGRDQRGAVIVEVTIVMTLMFATFCKRIGRDAIGRTGMMTRRCGHFSLPNTICWSRRE